MYIIIEMCMYMHIPRLSSPSSSCTMPVKRVRVMAHGTQSSQYCAVELGSGSLLHDSVRVCVCVCVCACVRALVSVKFLEQKKTVALELNT